METHWIENYMEIHIVDGLNREGRIRMLSAKQANAKTKEVIDKYRTEELSKIEKQIMSAISKGEFFINNEGYLSEVAKQRLKADGYKVKQGSQYNESYYVISWEQEGGGN